MYEEYEKEHEVELCQKLSKEQKRIHKDAIKKLKVNFKPKFDWLVFILLAICECLLFYFKGVSTDFFVYSFLVCILIISFFTDLKMSIIPNETNYLSAVVGFIYAVSTLIYNKVRLGSYDKGLDLILGGVVAFALFFAISGVSYLILKKEGMGGGDIKLVAGIGFFMGLKNFIQIFVLSFLIAAIVSIFLLILKKKGKSDYIPFGPFLCIGAYITMIVPFMTTAMIWLRLLY